MKKWFLAGGVDRQRLVLVFRTDGKVQRSGAVVHLLFEHDAPLGDGLRACLGLKGERPIDGAQKTRRIAVTGRHGRRHQNVLVTLQDGASASQRVHRPLAGDGTVERRAQRIDVRPRTLLVAVASGIVLLERREAGGHQRGQGTRFHAERLPGGAEIQHHGRAVVTYEQVVGFDIAMHESRLVHPFQPIEKRHEQRAQILLAAAVGLTQDRAEAAPLLVLHDHIGGVVGLEDAVHPDDIGMLEARQGACLTQEPVEAPAKSLGFVLRDRFHGAVLPAHRQIRG